MWKKLMRLSHWAWLAVLSIVWVPRPLVGREVPEDAGEELRQETDILVREVMLLDRELRRSKRRRDELASGH